MYIYIYDESAEKRRNSKVLIKIEKKITDLGLNGKVLRLKGITNIEKTIEDELKYEAGTIVVIGSDYTFHKTLNAVLKKKDKNPSYKIPVLSIIPLEEKNNSIASILGLNKPEQACDALLSRRTERVGVGMVDKNYFLTQIEVLGDYSEVEIGNDYLIEAKSPCDINIINLPLNKEVLKKIKIDFKDQKLKLYIKPQKRSSFKKQNLNESILSLENLFITKKTEKVLIDNCLEMPGGLEVKSSNKEVSLVVGKNRIFK